MIDLRFVKRDGIRILQWRYININTEIKWVDDEAVVSLASPISLIMEKNWSEWEDVPIVTSDVAASDTSQNRKPPDESGMEGW